MKEFLEALLFAVVFGGVLIAIFVYAMKEVKKFFGTKVVILTIVVLMVLILTFIPGVVCAQNYVEDQINISDGKLKHIVSVSVSGNLSGKVGWFFWSLNSQYWSEAYFGPMLSPTSWCQFGIGYGVETDDDPNRFGSFFWLGSGRYSFIGFFEKGGSGYWHRMIVNVALNKYLGTGVMTETFFDERLIGPRIEFTQGKIRLWATYFKKNFQMIGINFIF